MSGLINAYIDFETRSQLPITTVGAVNYLMDPKADIVCLGYKIEDSKTKIWVPGEPLPAFVQNPIKYRVYAFNALFDFRVWNLLGKRYRFTKLPIKNVVDAMALCGRFTFKQKLAEAGKILKLKVQKNPKGEELMKKISMPPFRYTRAELEEYFDYCRDDVESMYELIHALPAKTLSESEQKIWELTAKINNNGLPIDLASSKQIINVIEAYKIEQNQRLPELTGGLVTRGTQAKRIKEWVNTWGLKLPNLQAATVEKLLLREDLPSPVREVLELRQELGLSSTAKYKRIIEQYYKGRIYDNLRYYGSNTGRWAGMGFQLLNLPKSDVKEPGPIIDKFFDLSIIDENPVKAGKELVRSMIKASPGYMICASDYSSIENILLAFVTKDQEALDLFIQGKSQYIDMAAFLSGKPYEAIVKGSLEYALGKALILGCGFGLGANGFYEKSIAEGTKITMAEATNAVYAYRARYKRVVDFWYACNKAAINAVSDPSKAFKVHGNTFKCKKDHTGTTWLQLTLLSGRPLYYYKPEIEAGKFGPVVSCEGINPYNKQWMRMQIRPGRYVENIIQALARDIMAHGSLNLDAAGFKIIGLVHDEVILEVLQGIDCLFDVNRLLCALPEWAKGLPLRADGMIEPRYRKMD